MIDRLGIGRTQSWTLEPSVGTSQTSRHDSPARGTPLGKAFRGRDRPVSGPPFHALTPATADGPAPRERQIVGGRLTYAGLESAAAWEKVVMTFVVSTISRNALDPSAVRRCAPVAARRAVVGATMSHYDQQFFRHRRPRLRPSRIPTVSDPLSVATVPEPRLHATSVKADSSLLRPATRTAARHQPSSTFLTSILRIRHSTSQSNYTHVFTQREDL